MKKIICMLLIMTLALTAVSFAQDSGKKQMTMKESLLMPNWGSYQWSPDGSYIAFTKGKRDEKDWEQKSHIWLYDVNSGEQMQLTFSHKGESRPQWISNDKIVFTSSRDGKNKMFSISTKGGEAFPMFEDKDAPTNGTFSPDFKKLAYTKSTDRPDKKEWEEKEKNKDDGYFWEKKLTYRHIWIYDIETEEALKITEGDFDNGSPVWSPDGKWILFNSNRSGELFKSNNNSDLWIVSSDSGTVRQLTYNIGPDRSAQFSPDGKSIAYLSSLREKFGADHMELMTLPFEGGTPENLTDDLDLSAGSPVWSKDGSTIYFTAGPTPSAYLYKVPVNGGTIEKVSPEDEYVYGRYSLSENGTKWLYTGSSYKTTGEVFISDINFNNPKNILSPHNHMGEFEITREEVVTFIGADGWEINGIMTYPLNYEEGKKYPTILMVHGGPYGRYSKTFNTSAQIWASRGYAVIRTNPRGSSGMSFKFGHGNNKDWGGKDFRDVMAGVDYVISQGIADRDRLGIMGGSYGGFMTFWAITQTDRFKAAIGHAAIADWFSFYGQTDIPDYLRYGFGGFPWETKEIFEKFSPIEYIENVKTPILITHGDQDYRVNLQQGWQYYRSLMMLNKKVEFLRFPREGHGIREPIHRLQLDREQEKWMAKHLIPEQYDEIVARQEEELKKEKDKKKDKDKDK